MTQELADKLAAVEQGVARGRWRTDPDVIVESHKVYTEIMELRAAVQVYRDAKRVADLLAAKARHADLESRLGVPATTQTVEPITDRKTLERIAERALYGFYPNYVPNPAEFPCTCKLTLPVCDCLERFRSKPGVVGILQAPQSQNGLRQGRCLPNVTCSAGQSPDGGRSAAITGSMTTIPSSVRTLADVGTAPRTQ